MSLHDDTKKWELVSMIGGDVAILEEAVNYIANDEDFRLTIGGTSPRRIPGRGEIRSGNIRSFRFISYKLRQELAVALSNISEELMDKARYHANLNCRKYKEVV